MGQRADPRELPGGTVTLFFADVEGSTRLLTTLGDRFLAVRARSRELVRAAADAHGGHEVDWAGDGVFLVFDSAGEAIAAAVELQRALAAEWSADEALRLRIGLHTGEPTLDAEGYVGLDVVVAARICAAAHGGQIVVSDTTRRLAGTTPAPAASFVPLGTHRLKDVPEPEALFQLAAPGLESSFPPLSTLGGGTLPTLHHRLVGRSGQVEEVLALLADPGVRLVTITGVGGAGKSRLALEIASRAAASRPVHLVGLAPITHADLVPAAIARVLEVREQPGAPLLESVADALQRRSLLYLDNLEHLPEAAAHVRALLDAVPDLDVLATSRAPLRLSGERVLPLDPLPLADAVELFVELVRARGLRIGDGLRPTIEAICERVDCLPLAIEVVAARLAVLSAGQLLGALGEGVVLDLEGPLDLPERQRTLRSTLDWSSGLLTERQQALYGTVAVFAGGCTLEDLRAVAGEPDGFLPDLETLVLGSLVRGSTAEGETRLTMLETVREHALARLADRLDDVRSRHADRFVALALEGSRGLEGPEYNAWSERLERELDNLRAALDWLIASGRVEDALRTLSGLERFWRARGHVTEARRWLERALALDDGIADELRAGALWTAAQQAAAQSDWAAAAAMLEEARLLYARSGLPREEVLALANLSFVTRVQGDTERSAVFAEQAVAAARALGDDRATSGALMALADADTERGEHALALERYEEALALRRQLGDPYLVCDAVYNLGLAAFQAGAGDRARRSFEDALAKARELDEAPYVAAAQLMLALLDIREGDAAAAGPHALESLEAYTALEDDRSRARSLVALAAALAAGGRHEDAARALGAAAAARGDAPPDDFELPILARCRDDLLERLGADTLTALEREGAADPELATANLVTPATDE